MRKSRKVRARARQAAAVTEAAAVENPTELPQTWHGEGGELPPPPVALEVFTEEEVGFIWRAMNTYELPDSEENRRLWVVVAQKLGRRGDLPDDE